jgi:cation-transporting ATPase 13A1
VQFKFRLTAAMVVDFAGCFIVEVGCKYLFADLEPKPLVTRGAERRLKRRAVQAIEAARVEKEKEASALEKKEL